MVKTFFVLILIRVANPIGYSQKCKKRFDPVTDLTLIDPTFK
jgi:hypothetical protein